MPSFQDFTRGLQNVDEDVVAALKNMIDRAAAANRLRHMPRIDLAEAMEWVAHYGTPYHLRDERPMPARLELEYEFIKNPERFYGDDRFATSPQPIAAIEA